MFDMCKIGLYHCWVYDAQSEPDVAVAVGRRHYNEVNSLRCALVFFPLKFQQGGFDAFQFSEGLPPS